MKSALLVISIVLSFAGPAAAEPAPDIDSAVLEAARKAAAKSADVDARLRYSRMLRALFRFSEASAVMQEAARAAPDDARVWVELARLAALLGNRGVAGSHAQKAVRLGDDSGEARELLERLSAAVRIINRKAVELPEGSPARTIAPIFAALKDGNIAEASAGIAAPDWARERTAEVIRAYADYLGRTTGVDWAGYELAPLAGDGVARVRLLWKVTPAQLDFRAIAELPPAYRKLLPLAWADGLSRVRDESLREQAIAAARKASWTDVTVATAAVEDGKIAGLEVGGLDVFSARLEQVDLPESQEAQVGAALSPEEKELRREMFKNRYGKSEPAEDGAYMYKQILFALAIVALSALFLVWLVRREKRKGKGPR